LPDLAAQPLALDSQLEQLSIQRIQLGAQRFQ
jgi:hypothetical protein